MGVGQYVLGARVDALGHVAVGLRGQRHDDQIDAVLPGLLDDGWPIGIGQLHHFQLAVQLLGPVLVLSQDAVPVERLLAGRHHGDQGQTDLGIEHG